MNRFPKWVSKNWVEKMRTYREKQIDTKEKREKASPRI